MTYKQYRMIPEIIDNFEFSLPKIEVEALDSNMFLLNSFKRKYYNI